MTAYKSYIVEYEDLCKSLNISNISLSYSNGKYQILQNNTKQGELSQIEIEREIQNMHTKVLSAQSTDSLPFAYLIWWTIHQNKYQVEELNQIAHEVSLPEVITKRMVGDKEKSAWTKATQIGAYGVESEQTHLGLKVFYQTKDIKRGEWRAILAEFIDQNERKVDTKQVALLGRESDSITAELEEVEGINPEEVVEIILSMQDDMDERVGKIDDTKIRNAILNWLELKHRVCVRGTGGVYLLPVTPSTVNQVKEEALAVRNWVTQCHVGTFSIVELNSGGATTIEDFRTTAIAEIEKEIAEIQSTITGYNPELSDGKLAYSVGTQVKKLQALGEKIKAVNLSLGDIIDRVDAKYTVLLGEAKKLQQNAVVSSQQQNLSKGKESENSREKDKLSGSVFDRKKVRV